MRDDLGGDAEDVGCRAVIFGERHAIFRGIAAGFPAGEAFEEELEAAERCAAETVDGLVVVADGDDVAWLGGEEMEEFELGDVGVLKFIDEDVFEALLEFFADVGVVADEVNRAGDKSAEREEVFLAEDFFTHFISAGDFFLEGDIFEAFGEGVFIDELLVDEEIGFEFVSVGLEIVAGDEFVLAAGEKFEEVAEELAGLGEAAKFFELEARHVAAEENPVIDVFEDGVLGAIFFEDFFAESMEGEDFDVAAAFAAGFDDARLHFAGSFFCVGEGEDIFAAESGVGVEEVADAFGDDAGFAGAGAGDDKERPVAVSDGAALGVVELEVAGFERGDVEKRGIHVIRLAEIGAKRKRRRGRAVNACEKVRVRDYLRMLFDQRENFFANVVEADGLRFGAVMKIVFDYFSYVGAEIFPSVALG